jgi:diaminopimelate epimerase
LTECCGSGGVAARVALEQMSFVNKDAKQICFLMPGGKISITAPTEIPNLSTQRILIGPAQFVYEGQYSLLYAVLNVFVRNRLPFFIKF